jgi:hypothetical protein
MADPLDASKQFQATQMETVTFGILSALFALIGVFFAYLQLRQMYLLRTPEQDPIHIIELGLY